MAMNAITTSGTATTAMMIRITRGSVQPSREQAPPAQADRPRCESVRDRLGSSRGSRSGWERNKEGVPPGVYFDAARGSA
jgi:hypothetical protein